MPRDDCPKASQPGGQRRRLPRGLRVPPAGDAPIYRAGTDELEMNVNLEGMTLLDETIGSDELDLEGMRVLDNPNGPLFDVSGRTFLLDGAVGDHPNVVDERVFVQQTRDMLAHFRQFVLNSPKANHIIPGDKSFDDLGKRPQSTQRTQKARELHAKLLAANAYKYVDRSCVYKDKAGAKGIVYYSWTELTSGDVKWHGLPPALQNLAVWCSQNMFAECPLHVSKDPRHHMYKSNNPVIAYECLCHLGEKRTSQEEDEEEIEEGEVEEGEICEKEVRKKKVSVPIASTAHRSTVAVEGGYVEGNEYTDEELKFLAKDYIDFEYEDQTEPEPSNLPKEIVLKLDKEYHFEQAGVGHFIHCWHPTGHANSPTAKLVASAQMLGAGTAKRAAAVPMFIKNTSILHEVLGMMLKESLPEEWEVMHPVYKAGRWVREDTDNGFALGRAVIWKLQVDIHRDPQDGLGNICVVFNCGRYDKITKYDAGMAFPDLGLIFEYPPGSVLMFRSADLYHGVMPWEIPPCTGQQIGPGRISWVLFSSKSARERLAGKRPNWFVDTNDGVDEYQDIQRAYREAEERQRQAEEERTRLAAEEETEAKQLRRRENKKRKREVKRLAYEEEQAKKRAM